MNKLISLLAVSVLTAGLIVVAAPANAGGCYKNKSWNAYDNSNGRGTYQNAWWRGC